MIISIEYDDHDDNDNYDAVTMTHVLFDCSRFQYHIKIEDAFYAHRKTHPPWEEYVVCPPLHPICVEYEICVWSMSEMCGCEQNQYEWDVWITKNLWDV